MRWNRIAAGCLTAVLSMGLIAGCGASTDSSTEVSTKDSTGEDSSTADKTSENQTEAKQVIIYSNADDEAILAMSNALDANGYQDQAVAAKAEGLPIDYVDPTEGNFSLTESVAVLDKGDATNPLAMEIAQCIIENGRTELQSYYPNALYVGEKSDSENKSAYPKTFGEELTFELYEHHQEISEAAKP